MLKAFRDDVPKVNLHSKAGPTTARQSDTLHPEVEELIGIDLRRRGR